MKTGRKVDGSPVIAGGRVVFGSGDGRLRVVDLVTGTTEWTYEIGDSGKYHQLQLVVWSLDILGT